MPEFVLKWRLDQIYQMNYLLKFEMGFGRQSRSPMIGSLGLAPTAKLLGTKIFFAARNTDPEVPKFSSPSVEDNSTKAISSQPPSKISYGPSPVFAGEDTVSSVIAQATCFSSSHLDGGKDPHPEVAFHPQRISSESRLKLKKHKSRHVTSDDSSSQS
ncbi:hypothetical protein QJS10_CPA06g01259 [Acorus calamus]|uniref:Uncharacterized protein n=1 Tax=Acorus calamus TaxID=4465 RepID=A0AAV9EH93_ACOCL|nr:hypothetical protein QJS10_CPA06g01259 [Acorus calamus]